MVRLAILIVLATFGGCSGPQNQTHEVMGTISERVAGVTRVIESNAQLPSKILDARLIEQQFGDGQLGPSDFRSFVWIKVPADQVVKWRSALKTPPEDTPVYDLPPSNADWWIDINLFAKLTKYDSHSLFSRNGWVVIQDDGNIFALTYTH